MNETSTAQYTSDLFVLEYDLLAKDYPWVAWAECGIDAMNQAVVRFHNLRPEGLGHDAFGWYDNLYLRRNRLANSIELVVEEDGYGDFCVVEAVWDKIDEHLWHALVSACTELDAQAAFVIMLEITKADLRIRELTAVDEEAINALPLTPGDDMHRAHLRKEARQIAALMRLEGLPFNTVVKAVQECDPEEPALGANRVYLPDQLERVVHDRCCADRRRAVPLVCAHDRSVRSQSGLSGRRPEHAPGHDHPRVAAIPPHAAPATRSLCRRHALPTAVARPRPHRTCRRSDSRLEPGVE